MTASVGILHTTEGGWQGSLSAFTANNSWPHEMYDPALNRRQQFIPFDQPAKALRNMTGGVETNRRETDGLPGPDVIQVEIVAFAGQIENYSDEWKLNLALYVIDLSRRSGIPLEFPAEFHGSDAYGLKAPTRFTPQQWLTVRGFVGHQHVPENTHWDPGNIDWLPPLVRFLTNPPAGGSDMEPATKLTNGNTANDTWIWTHQQVDAIRAAVDALLARPIPTAPAADITTVSDAELTAEVARRLAL
jgi:hypothetical protein